MPHNPSPAQRRADRKYQKAAYGTVFTSFTVKMSISEGEMLRKTAKQFGTTPHAVLLQAARDFIAAHGPSGGDRQTAD